SQLRKHLYLLCDQFRPAQVNAGDIAGRSRHAVDMTKRNRIVLNCDHDDRQRAGRCDRLLETLLVPGGFHDDVDFAPDEIPNRLAHAIHPIPGVDELEGEILSFDVPKLAHPLIERHPEGECPRIWRRRTHTQYPRWSLLRSRRERPRRRRAAEQDELAPFQLIELHSVSQQPGPDCKISNWRGSVWR